LNAASTFNSNYLEANIHISININKIKNNFENIKEKVALRGFVMVFWVHKFIDPKLFSCQEEQK